MLKKLFGLLVPIAMAMIGTYAPPAQARQGYALMSFSTDYPAWMDNLVSLDVDATGVPEIANAVYIDNQSTAGAYAEGYYYVASSLTQGGASVPDQLLKVNIALGTVATVGPLEGLSSFVADMTYDNAQKKMYAVAQASDTQSNLYTIDLNTGKATRIATLGKRFFTLAATYTGQLYGITSMGDFYAISKTGDLIHIGHTGMYPEYFQSMEFDHTDGALYWLAGVRTISSDGAYELHENLICTVNPHNAVATRTSSFPETQLTGLYIPFQAAMPGAPAAVSDLRATPAPLGGNTATITWTNPSRTFGGDILKSLNAVEIYRDGALVTTLSPVGIASTMTWTDQLSETALGDFHTYKIVPVSNQGQGAPASTEIFIGKDLPKCVDPASITLTRLSQSSARVDWSPVTESVHGGWTDIDGLTYSVTRMPDNVMVAEGLTTTSYTQPPIEESEGYSFIITAVNSCGTSEPSQSGIISLGGSWVLPLNIGFSQNELNRWTILDANNDSNTWSYMDISWAKAGGAYFMSSANSGDDWLISRPIEFAEGDVYHLNIDFLAMGDHTVEAFLLKEPTPDNVAQSIGTLPLPKGWAAQNIKKEFTASQSGPFYLAFHVTTPQGNSYMLLDNLKLEQRVADNLQAVGIYGDDTPVIGHEYTYTVKVYNNGNSTADSFTAQLLDNNGDTLGSAMSSSTLAPGEAAFIPVSVAFTDDMGGISALKGQVSWADDAIANDNQTAAFNVSVLPAGSQETVKTQGRDGSANYHPFNLYNRYSAAQNIYVAMELGIGAARITALEYRYSTPTTNEPPADVHLQVYLANVDANAQGHEWIDKSKMTLVYDNVVDMVKGEGSLNLQFQNAFQYTGGDLAVITVSDLDQAPASYYTAVNFPYYSSPLTGNNALTYSGSKRFDFTEDGVEKPGISSVMFIAQTSGGTVAGVVKDLDGNPIAGATVTIPEIHTSCQSNVAGEYRFDFVPKGTYTVTVDKFGYDTVEVKTISINDDETVNLPLNLKKIPTYSVNGTCLTPEGSPVSGAEVKLTGYASLTTVTDGSGNFNFPSVVSRPSTIVATADWLVPVKKDFEVASDVRLGNMTMTYAHYAPGTPEIESDGATTLQWATPAEQTTIRYDNGVAATQVGFSESVGTIVIGNKFAEPMQIESLQWYTTSEGGPHNVVNLYVYELDSDGLPTSTLLWSERSIRNTDDEWTEYVPATPISAPNGCLVTLNYPGFLGLGVDNCSKEYPKAEGIAYFSTDFTNPEFSPLNPDNLTGNLMIRAKGYRYPEENEPIAEVGQDRAPLPTFYKYNIYRASMDGQWSALATVQSGSYADSSWETLPAGIYRYAVASLYPDGSESKKATSAYICKDMTGNIKVTLSTNSVSGKATGATLTACGADGDKHTLVLDETGTALFENLWRQSYDITASLPGYEPLTLSSDILKDGPDVQLHGTLKEIISTPLNLNFTRNENGDVRLMWNESGEIYDGFETHEPFAIACPGEVGWQYIDADGDRTFAEADFKFPGITQPMSMMSFFPKLTVPSIFEQRSASHPHEGDAELACFAGYGGSNDWFISPAMTYHNDVTFSFWARGYSQTYGEQMRIGFSEHSAQPEDFIWLTEVIDVPKQIWTHYEYTIPQGARYVAINVTSPDGFICFFDDVAISSGKGFEMNTAVSGPEVKYQVMLDGKPVTLTEECEHTFAVLDDSRHVAEVKAVYGSGESQSASIEIGQSGIPVVSADSLFASPNPVQTSTTLSRRAVQGLLADMFGRVVRTYPQGTRTIEMTDLPAGLYFLKVTLEDGTSHTLKLQKQ